ncbi:ATP-binding protein [Deinococcus koreensis]|uniref:Transcriptional regulator n=1 Tax=Deinococcus koreensis TaxID=2054903 RepID=A0A2K3URV2_9DEIO|nr:LuxR C-terminal-related transcriptional regulator [Deinococcus koreensis]PNY79230.1 transcriptional regulator [Deinococcus koreensis]
MTRRFPSSSHHLPAPATPLVGRGAEVTQVCGLLGEPEVALLTLTGPGGVGKTRLALEVARQLSDSSLRRYYPDGVVYVPLADVHDPAGVLSALGTALGIHESQRPTLEVLGDFLSERQCLLVLDNFEQVLEAATHVASVLRAAPDITVLVTSRARLGLYGEHEYPVSPLSLPGTGGNGEALQLFLERVRAIQPNFAPTPERLEVLREIVRRVDGLPLAIELAAARVRLLPPATLLARLDNRLALLQGGARDLPNRQQTLRATIDWSYDLLSTPEQHLFARLGVFVSSWSLEAAEAVCNVDGDLDVLEGLSSLTEKSLLQRYDADEARYGMLETLGEYSRERLAQSGELQTMQARLVAYSLAQVELIGPALKGEHQGYWYARLSLTRPNILSAMRICLHTQPASLGTFARSLGWMWSQRADYEAAPILREALQAFGGSRGGARGWVLYALAAMEFRQGQFASASDLARESTQVFEDAGEALGEAYARNVHSLSALDTNHALARQEVTASLALALAQGDAWLGTLDLIMLGWISVLDGQLDEAQRDLDAGSGQAHALGEGSLLGWAEVGLAALSLRRGETAHPAAVLRAALAYADGAGVQPVRAAAWQGLAFLAALQGQAQLGARLWGAAQTLRAKRNIIAVWEERLFAPALAALRDLLGEEALKLTLGEGRTLSEIEALELAHKVNDGPQEGSPEPVPATPGPAILTPREAEVLALLAAGLSNKQIASRLGTGVYTVNDHVSSVYSKLGVRGRSAATRYALEHGLA